MAVDWSALRNLNDPNWPQLWQQAWAQKPAGKDQDRLRALRAQWVRDVLPGLKAQAQNASGSGLSVSNAGTAVDPAWLPRIVDALNAVPGVRTVVSSGNVLSLIVENNDPQVAAQVKAALAPLETDAPAHVQDQLRWASARADLVVRAGLAQPAPAWMGDQRTVTLDPALYGQPGQPPPGAPAPGQPPGGTTGSDTPYDPLSEILGQQEVSEPFNDPTSRFPVGTSTPVDTGGSTTGSGLATQDRPGGAVGPAAGDQVFTPNPPPTSATQTVGQAVAAAAGGSSVSPWSTMSRPGFAAASTGTIAGVGQVAAARTAAGLPAGTAPATPLPSTATSGLPPWGPDPTNAAVTGATTVSAGTGTAATDAETSAFALIQQQLDSWGLGSLAQGAWDQIKQGRSQAEVLIWLRGQDAYKQRFVANDERSAAGLPAMSEAEIMSYEQSVRQIMRTAGLPEGFYDQPTDFANFLAKDVSPAEVQSRVVDGFLRLAQEPVELRTEWERMTGLPISQAAAWFIDPNRALPVLQRQLAMSEVSGTGVMSGFGSLSGAEADRLAGLGVTIPQAQQGFGQLMDLREVTGSLVGQTGGDVSRQDQLDAMFAGDANVREAIDRRSRQRAATFEAGGGLASSRTGLAGLGVAST